MFIVRLANGNTYTEGQIKEDGKKFTWDDIPSDANITAVQLAYPFPIRFKKLDGSIVDLFTPKLTLKDFDRYFFHNEATVPLMISGDRVLQEGKGELQAKIISGIDDTAKIVIECRMDKYGNTTISKYPSKRIEKSIKDGLFRKEIIKRGFKT